MNREGSFLFMCSEELMIENQGNLYFRTGHGSLDSHCMVFVDISSQAVFHCGLVNN